MKDPNEVTPIIARILLCGDIIKDNLPTKIENVGLFNYSSHILNAYTYDWRKMLHECAPDYKEKKGGDYRVEFYVGDILLHYDEFTKHDYAASQQFTE